MLEAPHGTTLAFDFGQVRIGVAQGDAEVAISHPLETIATAVKAERFDRIGSLIAQWQPRQLVVGLPVHMDGSEHELTRLSRRFAQRLHGRYALPVYLVDERLSSALAAELLREAQVFGRKQKPALDQVAAQAILQSFFEAGAHEQVSGRTGDDSSV